MYAFRVTHARGNNPPHKDSILFEDGNWYIRFINIEELLNLCEEYDVMLKNTKYNEYTNIHLDTKGYMFTQR